MQNYTYERPKMSKLVFGVTFGRLLLLPLLDGPCDVRDVTKRRKDPSPCQSVVWRVCGDLAISPKRGTCEAGRNIIRTRQT
jgi:hypothetical protein